MIFMYLQLIILTMVTAVACALPGNFLLLRGNALISDALSHAILFGIVVMFLIIQDINSPYIFIGAVGTGIITVIVTEYLTTTGRMYQDTAIGLLFPFLFSCAVLLINQYANNVHLDTDAIILGELAFAPFHRIYILGYDCGPVALATMSCITIINILYVYYFYKELKITTFDPAYATTIGYNASWFNYSLMIITSITIINAFQTTGTILVISFIITPPATAYLITKKLDEMIIASCLLSIVGVGIGFIIAHHYNSSIAGSIALANGCIFFITMLAVKINIQVI